MDSFCLIKQALGCLCRFAALSGSIALSVDAATITGQVEDADNAIFLEGAEVTIPSLDKSTFTTRRGNFRFTEIPAGTYEVIARASGYPQTIATVTVAEESDTVTTRLSFRRENIFELDDFIVEGTATGTAKALNIKRAAADLREVISSDAFGQFVDRNPAEALQRVPGVTVEDDQGEGAFVIIRGASPELANIQLDGIGIATPQPDGRRVNLNIVDVDQLERIEVRKTWLPSQPGNAIAGSVELITRSALDRGEAFASLNAAYTQFDIAEDPSYRTSLTFGDTFEGDYLNWLSADAAIGFQISANYSEDNRGSETLSFGWITSASYPFGGEPLRGFTLSNNAWRDYSITRERIGVSSKLELSLNPENLFTFSVSYNEFDDDEVQRFFSRSVSTGNDFSWDGDEFLTEALAQQLGYSLDDPAIQARLAAPTTSTTRRLTWTEAQDLGQLVYNPETKQFEFGTWQGNFDRVFDNEITTDEVLTYQFRGEHRFEFWEVDWRVYASEADRNAREIEMGFDGLGGISNTVTGVPLPRIEPTDFGGISVNPEFFFINEPQSQPRSLVDVDNETSTDERQGASIDLKAQYDWRGFDLVTQMGGVFDRRDKAIGVARGGIPIGPEAFDDDLIGNRLTLSQDPFFGGTSDAFVDNFGEFFQFGPTVNGDGVLAFLADPELYGVTLFDDPDRVFESSDTIARTRLQYSSKEDITAGYIQQTVRWKRWTAIFGFRYERTELAITNLSILTRNASNGSFVRPSFWRFLDEEDFTQVITRERSYSNLLPAFHLRRDIGEDMILRASITQTIARPNFDDYESRDIPSIAGTSYGTSLSLANIDTLDPQESINYDLSLDWSIGDFGLFTIAVFYKDLTGPIYRETRRNVGPNDETRLYAFLYDSRNASKTGPDDPELINSSPWTLSRQANAGDAELYGFEVGLALSLDEYLPDAFSGFRIETNFSTFESEVELLAEERVAAIDNEQNPVDGDPLVRLFRQPDILANASLVFERFGVFARISYNLRGDYLQSVYLDDDRELYEFGESPASRDLFIDQVERWDLTVRYNPPWFDFLQVFLEVQNFTNEPVTTFEGDGSRVRSIRYTEPVYTVGAKLAF